MNARDLAEANGRLAIELKAARAAGATGSDEDVTNMILAENGAGEINLGPMLTRLRRRDSRRRAGPGKTACQNGST